MNGDAGFRGSLFADDQQTREMRDFRLGMESRRLQTGIRFPERAVHFAGPLPRAGIAGLLFVTQPQVAPGSHDSDQDQSAAEQPEIESGKLQPASYQPGEHNPNQERPRP